MTPALDPAPLTWAELVLHVLAHARGTSHLAASLYDADYVAYSTGRLGPAESRHLAEDARILGAMVHSHQALSDVQLLAWLFESSDQAAGVAAKDLRALGASDVAEPLLLPRLLVHEALVELLRCAALLERDHYEQVSRPAADVASVQRALEEVAAAAPSLANCRIRLVLPLWRRGRVRGSGIWVGMPRVDGRAPSASHVAWQAAHEATVREVSAEASAVSLGLDERRIEQAAVVLLAERGDRASMGDRHAAWLAHFGDNAPSTSRAALSAEEIALLRRCCERSGSGELESAT
jgi:hypothetical protein